MEHALAAARARGGGAPVILPALRAVTQSPNRSTLLPRIAVDLGEAKEPRDRVAFDTYRRRLTAEFTKLTAWILVILTPLLWPTDRVLFADMPAVLAFFDAWRPRILGLGLLALIGMRFVPALRHHAAAFATAVLAAGSAICGVELGRLGATGEIYYSCSYLLSLATVPLIVGAAGRIAVSLTIPLAFTIPYAATHPEFFTGNPFARSLLMFSLLAVVGSVGLGHSLYVLVRGNFAQREVLARQASELARAREKSERLLLNVLPGAVALQLQEGADTVADAHDDVSVLFVDICGFTRLSDGARPAVVVRMLDEVFSAFDALVERHGVEKIKTIGDAYMVAAGLPEPRPDHARAIADVALDMLEVIGGLRDPDGRALQVRIGAHCGPVVAGVIGRKRFIYDLWGDTVNTASRMESHGEPGTVQITEALARRLAGEYRCELRGTIAVKGKGEMTTYFLRARVA
jgi:class 3 adenylate cyclase